MRINKIMYKDFNSGLYYDTLTELLTAEGITPGDEHQCFSDPTKVLPDEASQIAEFGEYYGEPVRLWIYETCTAQELTDRATAVTLKTNQDRYHVLLNRMQLHSIKRDGSPTGQHADLAASYTSDLNELEALETTLGISYAE